MTAYLVHRETAVEPYTLRGDRTALGKLTARMGERAIAEITTADVQAVAAEFRRAGYQHSTLIRYRDQWSGMFQWAGRKDSDNPARSVELGDPGEVDTRAFTDDEIRSLFATAKRLDAPKARTTSPRWPESWALWLAAGLYTGGRFAELMALEWGDFKRGDRTVRFARQIRERGAEGVKGLKGKRNRTALVLPQWWAHHRPRALGRVLSPQINHGVGHHTATKWADVIYSAAEIRAPGEGWHMLRHTYSRLFLESGGSMDELQRSLGHKDIQTTQETYGHFTADKAAARARVRIYGRGR